MYFITGINYNRYKGFKIDTTLIFRDFCSVLKYVSLNISIFNILNFYQNLRVFSWVNTT